MHAPQTHTFIISSVRPSTQNINYVGANERNIWFVSLFHLEPLAASRHSCVMLPPDDCCGHVDFSKMNRNGWIHVQFAMCVSVLAQSRARVCVMLYAFRWVHENTGQILWWTNIFSSWRCYIDAQENCINSIWSHMCFVLRGHGRLILRATICIWPTQPYAEKPIFSFGTQFLRSPSVCVFGIFIVCGGAFEKFVANVAFVLVVSAYTLNGIHWCGRQ